MKPRKTKNPTRKKSGRLAAVRHYGRRYIPLFMIAEVCILVSYGIALILPQKLATLTDKVLYGRQTELLAGLIRSYVLLFLIAALFNFIYAFVWQTLQNRYIVDIKNDLFRKTLYAKASFLADMNSGDILSRIDGDSEQFLHVVQRNLFHFVNSLLLCAGIIWTVAGINRWIALILVVAAALPILLTRLFGILTQKYARQSRETEGAYTGRLFEIIKGFRELRLLGAQWWARNQIMMPLRKLIALGNKLRRVDFAVNKGIYFINLSASLAIYGLSAWLILNGRMTVGAFLAVLEYVALTHKKFNWMLRIYLDWFSRKVSLDRVNEILRTDSEEHADGEPLDRIRRIDFRGVDFRYGESGPPVLDNVTFTLRAGERTALVGASGVGKTTLTSLLLRLYEPQSGSIAVNGRDIREYRLADLRGRIGVVSQEVRLFDDTVRANLAFGAAVPDEALWAALDRAGAREVVEALPAGLDTAMGAGASGQSSGAAGLSNGAAGLSSGAAGLSGGEKQRLMLARAFLGGASALILDEATSALDVHTEEAVTGAMMAASPDGITLVVSHRLSTIARCDRVILLEDGRVAATGAPADMLAHCRAFQQLFGEAVA